MSEGRRCGAILQALSDKLGTCLSTELRRVDLEVIDAWFMDSLLPSAHRQWNRAVTSTVRTPRIPAAFHDQLNGAPDAHEEHGETCKASGVVIQNPPRHGIRVVMANVHDNTQSAAAVSGDGVIHRATQQHNKRLEIRTFSPWTEPNPRLVASRSHAHEPVNPQVHLDAVEGLLNDGSNAGLTGTWCSVKNDDLAGYVSVHEIASSGIENGKPNSAWS